MQHLARRGPSRPALLLPDRSRVRHGRRFVVAATAALLATLIPLAAGAQDADPAATRQELRQQAAANAADVDATRASQAEVSAALAAVGADVTGQQAVLEDAQRVAAAANAGLGDARQRVLDAQAALDQASRQLREAAVDGYINPPEAERMDRLFTSEPGEGEVRDALARTTVRSSTDAVDQMRAARQDLARAEVAATAAAQAARDREADAEAQLAELQAAYDRQAGLVADVQDRLDHLLSEAAAIGAKDGDLAAQLQASQSALAAQVAALPSGGGSGSAEQPSVVGRRSTGSIEVATVGGIEVNADIADQLADMMAAAAADGVYLAGSGYRDPDEQIALRMQHCGTSDYAIWDMPSGDCSPPVARPGRSMHEQGLAIDFSLGGDLIRSRYGSTYSWLADNAASYGFYNLPSEPWHWSTTGS